MKFLTRLLGILLIATLLAFGALFFLPGERIARIAGERISDMTGREVTMTGDTAISFYPVLGISTGETTIANADWARGGPMLSADSLKVGVDPIALMRGEVRITGLEVARPRIVVERDADGRGNWEIGVDGVASTGQGADDGDSAAPARESRALALTLDRALITDASVSYIDARAGTRQEIAGVSLDLRWPDYDGAATFDLTLRPAGEDVRASGTIAALGPLIDGAVSPINVTLEAGGGSIALDGRASAAPQLEARVAADLPDTAAFLRALGLPPANLPEGLGRTFGLTGQLNVTEDSRVSLRDAALDLGGNRIAGAVDATFSGTRPRVTARLDAGALDLSMLGGGADAEGGGGASDSGGGSASVDGWSRAPIDASALGLLDADISLVADSLDLGQFNFGAADIGLAIDRSRAVATLRRLDGYGGTLGGQAVANNRSGLSVGGDLEARGIDMERFLADAADITRFSTTGTMAFDFLGVGQSQHEIMNSLSGNLSLATGRGVISGIDLDRLMRTGDGSGGTTVFDSMGASFVIADGDMRGDDLKMSMPFATATGEGRIGLGARDIDYLFTPVLLQGENSRGLAIPVSIEGPWSNPRIRPDLERAIDLNLREERKELERRAREEVEGEVESFVEKELGVTVEEGQSLEDALRQGVEDEAVREIFKLFD